MISLTKVPDRIPSTDVDTGLVGELASSIGSEGFIEAMLTFANRVVDAHFISVFCLDRDGEPLQVGTTCSVGRNRAQLAAQGYARHYRDDQNYAVLRADYGHGDFLTTQQSEDITSFTYRRDCYHRPGITDRISLIRSRPGYGLSISLYRSVEAGPFDVGQTERILSILGLMLALAEKHIAFDLRGRSLGGHSTETRLQLAHPQITARERQVAALTIDGHTARQISKMLNIGQTTVITHRKNAYKRLGVGNLKGLLTI